MTDICAEDTRSKVAEIFAGHLKNIDAIRLHLQPLVASLPTTRTIKTILKDALVDSLIHSATKIQQF